MDKAALRSLFTARRAQLSVVQIAQARAAVREEVLQVPGAHQWRRVAAYVPLRTEPGSPELLIALATAGADVVVPILLADRDLDWIPWDGGKTLGPDAIGDMDAVIVPALAVAMNGVRLGRGGGSYDRALRRVASPIPVIALVYADEVVQELPQDEWDQPVTAVVTPAGWQELP